MNLVGKRFGKLTVTSKTDHCIHGSVAWLCRCDCGNSVEVSTRDLNRGAVKSCGCLKKERCNLVGHRFGKLTVVKKETYGSHSTYLCKCDCGNMLSVRGDSLQSGKTVSCGCSKSSQEKIAQMYNGRKITDHTSPVFFKGTVSKNSVTGINGVTIVKGKYRAYIGYKNKFYHLIETDNLDVAKYIRSEAESAVKNGNFEEWILDFRKEKEKK